ncbi:MAG: (2Fe-2S)-binding protein, partial [Firmicutes bacterium]|nr:(2Fe-2S)-binding protein [Bacillota bacterium]
MVSLTINDQKITVSEGTTILEAAREVGIDIPHLCYLEGINEIGACRVCIVENKGMDTLITACNTPVEEGMQIYTNSPKVRKTRRINVSLILSD